jgi:mRNA interferase MazF
MEKDYIKWNSSKVNINNNGINRFYKPREVWWCALGENIGFEQDGTGEDFDRPVIVIRPFSKNVCWVIPLTTSQKKNIYHFDLGQIDGKKVAAIISQLRLVDTKRFIDRLAVLDESVFNKLKESVKRLLD